MMYRRPGNVTFAGITVCVFAMVETVLCLLGLSAQDSPGVTSLNAASDVVEGIAAFAMLVAGIYILQGENWARWFYLAVCALLVMYCAACLMDRLYKFVPAGILLIIVVVLLFLPNANRYYRSGANRW